MINEPLKRTDPEVLKALARDAKELMDNQAFAKAILDLRQSWFGELMIESDFSRQQDTIAKLKVLEAVAARISSMMFATGGQHGRR